MGEEKLLQTDSNNKKRRKVLICSDNRHERVEEKNENRFEKDFCEKVFCKERFWVVGWSLSDVI